MIENRKDFNDIKTYEEFCKYYWYRDELSQICKSLNLEYRGTKKDLNFIIKEYFNGNFIKKSNNVSIKNTSKTIELDTPLLECGFSFNDKFRSYFSAITGVYPFKFNADMAAAFRKVKKEKDTKFTIKDMLKVYYGKSDYEKYDHCVCQWNTFLKDFCSDTQSDNYNNKIKVASIIWKEVRNSQDEKVYKSSLLEKHKDKISEYEK